MKCELNIIKPSLFLLSVILIMSGCDKEYLEPQVLSFYTPGTFSTPEALQSVLVANQSLLRDEFIDRRSPISTQMFFSDICVEGSTDIGNLPQDLNNFITPSGNLGRIEWYWNEGYRGIKNANTVISRIDGAKYKSEEQRNALLGSAYFHRAYWYYHLTHLFGNVPLLLEEITIPRTDFTSEDRVVILQRMKEDLEFAQTWVSDNVNRGDITKGAVSHLLTKVNLALGLFDDAIVSASDVIDGGVYQLMTQRFGIDASDPNKNVTWDLHRPENKSLGENTEAILLTINRENVIGNYTTNNGNLTMRNAVPNWYASINTPNGNKGTLDRAGIEIDLSSMYGRGTGVTRNTNYQQNLIWKLDDTDERHAPGNWVRMEDLVYNNIAIKGTDPYYGEPLQMFSDEGNLLVSDTIRTWYDWPHYKTYVYDINNVPMMGGATDWYVFRLAETYLLRAEAYFWKGQLDLAASDINKVRVRANAIPIADNDVTMRMIIDERARELYYEEPRKTELTRISFIFALTGKVAFNGKSYNLDNFSTDNFYYDQVMDANDFYNKGARTNYGNLYTMSPYHVLWPIPAPAINANVNGNIPQNEGY